MKVRWERHMTVTFHNSERAAIDTARRLLEMSERHKLKNYPLPSVVKVDLDTVRTVEPS